MADTQSDPPNQLQLVDLPGEFLDDICERLYNSHLPSLLAFSRTNKRCRAFSMAVMVRTLHFVERGQDNAAVADEVQKFRELLQKYEVFNRVRCVLIAMSVYGNLSSASAMHEPDPSSLSSPTRGLNPLVLRRGPDPSSAYAQHCLENDTYYLVGSSVQQNKTIEQAYATEERWKPLVSLILELPVLHDFVFACYDQFPTCLLRALHSQRPYSRLHIHKFYLWSSETDSAMDKREFELVTSPLLHSVRVSTHREQAYRLYPYESKIRLDHLYQMMVQGLTPNLKVFANYVALGRRPTIGCEPWETLGIKKNTHHNQSGSLRYLHLFNSGDDDYARIVAWNKSTDLSCLRALSLDLPKDDQALQYMISDWNLDHLESLHLTIPSSVNDELVAKFLARLKQQVTSLSISHERTSDSSQLVLPPLQQVLGENLRGLYLDGQCFVLKDVVDMTKACVLLEDVTIPIKRIQGSSLEVACYSTLGRMLPRLQRLTLNLKAVWEHRNGEYEFGFDVERDRELGRKLLIDWAIDKGFALATFAVISSSKHGDHAIPLQTLRIISTLAYESYDIYLRFGMVAPFVACSWLVERESRVLLNQRQHLRVTELLERSLRIGRCGFDLPRPRNCVKYIRGLYNGLWKKTRRPKIISPWPSTDHQAPARIKTTSDKWLDGWHSFPLDLSGLGGEYSGLITHLRLHYPTYWYTG